MTDGTISDQRGEGNPELLCEAVNLDLEGQAAARDAEVAGRIEVLLKKQGSKHAPNKS